MNITYVSPEYKGLWDPDASPCLKRDKQDKFGSLEMLLKEESLGRVKHPVYIQNEGYLIIDNGIHMAVFLDPSPTPYTDIRSKQEFNYRLKVEVRLERSKDKDPEVIFKLKSEGYRDPQDSSI